MAKAAVEHALVGRDEELAARLARQPTERGFVEAAAALDADPGLTALVETLGDRAEPDAAARARPLRGLAS